MGAERGGEHLGGLSEDRVGRKCGGRDPDRAGGLLPKLAHGPKFRFDLLQPGAHRPEQAFSSIGPPSRRTQPHPEATISVWPSGSGRGTWTGSRRARRTGAGPPPAEPDIRLPAVKAPTM